MDFELYEKLVKSYFSTTLHTIFKMLDDYEQSEYINQELWIKVMIKDLDLIKERSPDYIVNMAKKAACDAMRKNPTAFNSTDETKEVILESKVENIEGPFLKKEEEEKCNRLQQEVYYRLSKSETNQQVFICMLDGLQNSEIALKLNLTIASVEQRILKITKIIKEVFRSS